MDREMAELYARRTVIHYNKDCYQYAIRLHDGRSDPFHVGSAPTDLRLPYGTESTLTEHRF